jgi:hypothetical protein
MIQPRIESASFCLLAQCLNRYVSTLFLYYDDGMGTLGDATFIRTVTASHMQGSDSQLFASCHTSHFIKNLQSHQSRNKASVLLQVDTF